MDIRDYQAIMDGVAKIVNDRLKAIPAPAPVDMTAYEKRIETLEEQNLALLDMLAESSTQVKEATAGLGDKLRAITDTQGEQASVMDALKAGIDQVSEARSLDLTELNKSNVLFDERLNNINEAVSNVWDDVKDQVASMIPDLDEHDAHLEKRFDEVFKGIGEAVDNQLEPIVAAYVDANVRDGKSVDMEVVTRMVDQTIKVAVDSAMDVIEIPTVEDIAKLIPAPIKGDKGDTPLASDIAGHMVNSEVLTSGLKRYIDESVDYKLIIREVVKRMPELIPPATAPNDVQVIEAVKAIYPTIRQDLIKLLPKIKHRGTYSEDDHYDVGDEVIKGGSTYRLIEASTDGPPSDAWQMIAQRGKPQAGKAGVGVADASYLDGSIILHLTDGTTKSIKLPDPKPGKSGVGIKTQSIIDGKTWLVEYTNGDVESLDLKELIVNIINGLGELPS